MATIYKDSAQHITIERCIELYKMGIDVIFDEGRHVMFSTEKEGKNVNPIRQK